MIQRSQSIFLLLAIVSIIWVLFSGLQQGGALWVSVVIYGTGGLVAGFAFFALTLYKQRHRQQLMTTIALAVMVVFAAFLYGNLYFAGALSLENAEGSVAMHLISMLMPAVGYIALRLALVGIKRDIKMVQSADRLR